MTTQNDTNMNWNFRTVIMIMILVIILSAILTIIMVGKLETECNRLGGNYAWSYSCYKEKDGELVKYTLHNFNGEYRLVRE